jgi:hypothetical protein
MLTDMAIKYKKDDMQRLLNYAEVFFYLWKDFKKLNAEILNTIEVRRLKEVFNLKTSQLHQMINRNDEVIIWFKPQIFMICYLLITICILFIDFNMIILSHTNFFECSKIVYLIEVTNNQKKPIAILSMIFVY